MAELLGTWIYIETGMKSHIGCVTEVRKDGYSYVPLTNEDILDADRITLCPAYDYMGAFRSKQLDPQTQFPALTRKFRISSLSNLLEDVTMHVMNGNIVFFSDLPAQFVSDMADVMYAAIDESINDGITTIVAEL